jgi:hypothetical protein
MGLVKVDKDALVGFGNLTYGVPQPGELQRSFVFEN